MPSSKNTLVLYVPKDAKCIVKDLQVEAKRHRLSTSQLAFMCIEAGMGFTVQGLDGMKIRGVVKSKRLTPPTTTKPKKV